MNKIPPAALTNEIAKSAAVQMSEYDYAQKKKRRRTDFVIAEVVPVSIVKEIVKHIPIGAGENENN